MPQVIGGISGGVRGGVAGGVVLSGNTTNVADADYTILASDRRVVITSLTATRTVTLPAANSVSSGTEILVVDASGSLFPIAAPTIKKVTISRAGSDTIRNSFEPGVTTTVDLRTPYGKVRLMSNGSNTWTVVEAERRGVIFLFGTASNRPLNIPNNTWTPLYFQTASIDTTSSLTIPTANTTVAAGSNGAVLPQATINVADASSFASTGYAAINISGTETIFAYTGKTGTSFTGCNAGINTGISVGTLATGNTVTQVLVELAINTSGLWNFIAQASLTANGTGVRGIRIRSIDGVLNLPGGSNMAPSNASVATQVQCALQPGVVPTIPNRIEVFQNSGGNLTSIVDGIQAPLFMGAQMSEL